MDLDWDKLRVLKVVADCGSMAAAAQRLGEAPVTVGRKIAELEEKLGAQLILRTTKGATLTETGYLALRHIDVMQDAAKALSNQVVGSDHGPGGEVRLTLGDGLGGYWLGPRIPEFQRQNPEIRLGLDITNSHARLPEQDFDLAIQFSKPDNPDVIAKRLGVMHYSFFASRDYLNVYGAPSSVYELPLHRCILHSEYINQPERWSKRTDGLTKAIEWAVTSNSTAVMVNSCARGGGIAVLPTYYIEADERLIHLELNEVTPIQFWLVYTRRMRNLRRGQIVIDWVRSLFNPKVTSWFRETYVQPERTLTQAVDLPTVASAPNATAYS